MAEPDDQELLALARGGTSSLEAQTAEPSDAELLALARGPQHGSLLEGTVGQAVHGFTLHGDNYFTSPEWQAKSKNFQKGHPVLSGLGEAAGFVGGTVAAGFVPGAQGTLPARAGYAATRLAKAADYLLPYGNFARAASAKAPLKTIANESGKGMLKAGAAMRLNDPLAKPATEETAESPELMNVAQRLTKAADLPSMAWDYGGGAVGGVIGNKVGGYLGSRAADLGQAAAIGNLPKRGAVLDIKHEIERDSPAGMDATLAAIRNLVYGEDRTLARHGGGAIPQSAEREMARQFQKITNEGYTDAQAEQILARYWNQRAQGAQRAIANPTGIGPPAHPDAWLVSKGGQSFTPGTMGGWGRTAGTAYRDRNAIPSNLTELTALATGGEAPALQTTLRKLLNLNSEGGARSSMLRDLRDRQKAIGPQMETVARRFLGDGDVGQIMAGHVRRAEDANALYPQIFDTLKGLGPEAERRLAGAIGPVVEDVLKKAGNKKDAINMALKSEAQKFFNEVEVPGAGSQTRLSGLVTENVKDEAGNIVKKIQRQVPLEKQTLSGATVDSKINPGGITVESRPVGDLESILALRRALKDAYEGAYRGGQGNLGHDLKAFHENINKALRGLGGNQDAFSQAMGKWAAANDTRGFAAGLERNYKDALGLNLTAKSGSGLIELERMFKRFRGSDEPNKDMIRRGIMGQLKAKIETGGDTHDVAKIFTNQRARQILNEMIGKEATEEFGGFVARAGLATNTFNMNKGSHTASIMDSDKESGWLANIASALYHGNPLRAIAHMGEKVGDTLKRKKHGEMTELLSAGTHDPARLEEVLGNIARAAAPVSPRLQAATAKGRPYGTVAGAGLSKRRDE